MYNRMVVDERKAEPSGSTPATPARAAGAVAVAVPMDEAEVDLVFHALADATRRDILRRAMHGLPSVSELARHYPMSFAAVQKHVAVLERAGLVTKQRQGRAQLVATDGATIRRANELLAQLESRWRDRLDRFADVLAETTTEGATP